MDINETRDIKGLIADIQNGKLENLEAKKPKDPNAMGKDEFLKLLTTQLQYQDPMSPMDNSQMMAQLAQFTALEQMNNLNTSVDALRAQEAIGKVVTSFNSDNNTESTGLVQSVSQRDGEFFLNILTEKGIIQATMDQVTNIQAAELVAAK